jgi:hypothetical protein
MLATPLLLFGVIALAVAIWNRLFTGAGGAVRLLSYTGSRTCLDVASRGWNLLVTSDASWPGWRITWNGARLPPVLVNGAFLGAFLPPGKGVLELRYRPREFDFGLALAAGLVASGLYRRRRDGPD